MDTADILISASFAIFIGLPMGVLAHIMWCSIRNNAGKEIGQDEKVALPLLPENPPLFSVGDTVRLKSGGPNMTISRFRDPDQGHHLYICVWFDEGVMRSHYYREHVLVRV